MATNVRTLRANTQNRQRPTHANMANKTKSSLDQTLTHLQTPIFQIFTTLFEMGSLAHSKVLLENGNQGMGVGTAMSSKDGCKRRSKPFQNELSNLPAHEPDYKASPSIPMFLLFMERLSLRSCLSFLRVGLKADQRETKKLPLP